MGICFSPCPQVLLTHRFLPSKDAHSVFLLSQVKAIINPEFIARVLSPEAALDPLGIAEELEQEEELTSAQVSQGRV